MIKIIIILIEKDPGRKVALQREGGPCVINWTVLGTAGGRGGTLLFPRRPSPPPSPPASRPPPCLPEVFLRIFAVCSAKMERGGGKGLALKLFRTSGSLSKFTMARRGGGGFAVGSSKICINVVCINKGRSKFKRNKIVQPSLS